MKETGKMIKQMVMGNIDKKMERFSKETGKMTNNMERELRFGEILLNTKEITLMGRNKVMEY